jgi:hypothetical protein
MMKQVIRFGSAIFIVWIALLLFTGSTFGATLSINLNDGTVVTYDSSKIKSITISDAQTFSSLPRTNLEKRLTDLQRIKNALEMYYKRNNAYPKTDGRWDGLYSSWGQSKADWIPGLVPNYLNELPRDPRMHTDSTQQYIYYSNGVDYKLISHNPEDCDSAKRVNPAIIDPRRNCWAYGFWTNGADW